jgi:spermidine synthase
VNPWEDLDGGPIPGSAETLRLRRRGDEFAIVLGPIELMNSRKSGSERALAAEACARLRDRPGAAVLIGGLGMGFTLRAALDGLGPRARIVVAELVPAVADWARGPLAELFAGALDDPRVRLHLGDVGALLRAGRGAYDAILLDVDNGPEGLTRPENDRLYDDGGLAAARAALRPRGILGVWSQGPDRAFAGRLRRSGFAVEEIRARAHGGGGRRHIVWIATRSEAGR